MFAASLACTMTSVELTGARLHEHSSGRLGLDEVATGPSIVPTEPSPADDSFLREQDFGATAGDEHFFYPAKEHELQQILRGSGSQRKLIAGSVVVVALTVGALAHFFWPASGGKQIETEQVSPAVDSAPAASVQAAPRATEASLVAPTAISASDLPTSLNSSPSASTAPTATSSTTETARPDLGIMYLQRPGVNIRSTPSTNGPALGTASKGTRFTVKGREGDWVQVESGRLKGWIKSQFLAATDPR
jgi:hypothetical protein